MLEAKSCCVKGSSSSSSVNVGRKGEKTVAKFRKLFHTSIKWLNQCLGVK